MSKDTPKEFKRECIGFVESDIFPTMCAHFRLDGTCSFFIKEGKGFYTDDVPSICDDLKDVSLSTQ